MFGHLKQSTDCSMSLTELGRREPSICPSPVKDKRRRRQQLRLHAYRLSLHNPNAKWGRFEHNLEFKALNPLYGPYKAIRI